MKKKSSLLTVILTTVLVLSACSVSTNPNANSSPNVANKASETKKDKPFKVGFANLTESIPFTVQVRDGIERAAKAKGIDLVIANNNLDGATALANAENFITQQVDAVIEYQTDAEFGKSIMNKFNTKKIPVIAIDIPMEGATFFGADNYNAGLMGGKGLGEAIKKKWNGQVNKLIMLELPQSGPLPAKRMVGQREGLESVVGKIDDANVIHLDSKGEVEVSYKLINDVLQKIPKGEKIAIVAITDDAALGAVKSLQAAGRENDALIASQNGDKNIREEIMRENSPVVGSTGYFPDKYGDYLIDAMVKIRDGKKIPETIYVEHAFLTKETMSKYYK